MPTHPPAPLGRAHIIIPSDSQGTELEEDEGWEKKLENVSARHKAALHGQRRETLYTRRREKRGEGAA